jgi:hypothetical protein
MVVGKAPQERRFVAHLQIDDVDEQDGAVFPARVMAAFEDSEIQQIGSVDLQSSQDRLAQGMAV